MTSLKNIPAGSPLVVSFSGGETSAYMLHRIAAEYNGEVLVFFANTGKEEEETLEFVQAVANSVGMHVHWVEYTDTLPERFKKVDYHTADRSGRPFEEMIVKYGLPNVTRPHCTRELKEATIRRALRHMGVGKYYTALGYRPDEPQRVNWAKAKKKRQVYPLITDYYARRSDILAFWARQPFRLNLQPYQGNCDCCWKKSGRKLQQIASESPEKFKWWAEMEEKHGQGQYSFYRGHAAALDFIQNPEQIEEIMSFSIFTQEQHCACG